MKKQKFNFPVKFLSVAGIIFLAIFFLISYSWKTFRNSKIFSVRQIMVRNSDFNLDYLKGRNIFSIDLNWESRQVAFRCPDCKTVRFSRILPNLIVVDVLKRRPLALVKFYKDFAVDEEGILFAPDALVIQADLPVIYGLETKIFAPKAGTKYKRRELDVAIEILREFKANKNLAAFSLKRINVAKLEEANFFILLPRATPQEPFYGFEVRTAAGNLKQKMIILSGVIMQARREWQNIKYIDLRFNEPVIKLNNKP